MSRRLSVTIYAAFVLLAAVCALVSAHAAAIGAFVLLVLLPAVSLLWNLALRKYVQAQLSVSAIVQKGKETDGELTVRCGRRHPAGQVTADVDIENELTGETGTVRLALTPKDGDYTAAFSFCGAYCGRINLTVTRVSLSDCFDLVRLPSPARCVAHCTVLPETFPVEVPARAPSRDTGEADAYMDAGGGSDFTEVYRLRPYVPGDSLRGMHWKLSSKLDTPIYRDPHLAVRRSLLLFWDKTPCAPAVADALAEAVFSVAEALSEQRIPFTLGVSQSDEMHMHTVGDTDSLLPVLPLLLRGAPAERQAPELTDYGRIFWFTAQETAPQAEHLTALYCMQSARKDLCGVVFTPRTVRQTLHRLEWEHEG